MKRTITEILVEVEETVAVCMMRDQSADEQTQNNESPVCPRCGQKIPKTSNSEKEEKTS